MSLDHGWGERGGAAAGLIDPNTDTIDTKGSVDITETLVCPLTPRCPSPRRDTWLSIRTEGDLVKAAGHNFIQTHHQRKDAEGAWPRRELGESLPGGKRFS